jgi:hypothetical protein
VGANQAAHPRERVILANQLQSFRITPLADQAYITGNIDARGTGHLTGGWRQDVTVARRTIVSFNVTLVHFPVMGQSLGGNPSESNSLLVLPLQETVCQRFHGRKVLGPAPASRDILHKLQ